MVRTTPYPYLRATGSEDYGPETMLNVHVDVYVPLRVFAGIESRYVRVTVLGPPPVFAAAL